MESKTDNRSEAALWWQYAVVALVLVVGLVSYSMLGSHARSASSAIEPDTGEILTGDWAVKTYLVEKRHPGLFGKQKRDPLSQALDSYVTAATRVSPAAYRRAGALSEVLGKPDAERFFDKLDSKDIAKLVPDVIPKPYAAELRAEANMWRHIYSSEKLDRVKAEEYAALIRKVSIGPMGPFALHSVYSLAGMNDVAQRTMNEAGDRAVVSVLCIVGVALGIAMAGLAGLVFVIFYARNPRKWRVGAPVVAVSHAEAELPASDVPSVEPGPSPIPSHVLIQSFIFYLIAIVVVEIGLAYAVMPYIRNLPREESLLDSVLIQFAGSAASGVLALAVLISLARQSGGSLAAIGLNTRDLRANVLAGIAGACALVPILLAAAILSNIIFRGIPSREHPIIPMLMSGNSTVFGLLLIVGAVFAPFFEEIFFRGVLYNGLKAKLGVSLGIIVSASVFAILHPQLPSGFLPIFAIGALFAGLLETRRSLVPSMVAHALNNGVIFVVIYFAFMQ